MNNWIDAAIFVIYLAILLVVGYITAKWTKTFEDYAVAGRRMKAWLAFSTIAATWIGGGITIGVAGKAYAGKAIGVWGTTIGFGTTLILLGLFYAGPLRNFRLTTLADFYSGRYGKKWIGGLSGVIIFAAYIFAVTAQVVAGSVLLSTVFGWDYTMSVVLSGGIVIAYTAMGGLWAVAMTDFLQLLITFTGVLVALALGLSYVGPSEVLSKMSIEGMTDPRVFLALDFWALVIVLALGDIPAPDLVQRVLAAKDTKTAKISSMFAGIAYYITGIASLIIGTMMAIVAPDLPDPQLAFPTMIKYFMPVGLSGLVLSGLMAAVMSNADSMLLAPATVFVKNIVKDILKPDMSDGDVLKTTRIVVVAIGIISIIAGVAKADVLYWLILAFDVLFAALFIPLTLGLFWKNFNWFGAASSIIAGAISRIVFEYALNTGIIVDWWVASLGAPAISLVAGVLAHYATSVMKSEA